MELNTLRFNRLTVELVIGGQKLTVRPLTTAESLAISHAFPAPQAPMMKDPTRGSLAEPIPNRQDPAYQRAFAVYRRQELAGTAAVAIGATIAGRAFPKEEAGRTAWLQQAAEMLLAEWTDVELMAVDEASRRLGGPDALNNNIKEMIVFVDDKQKKVDKPALEIPANFEFSVRGLMMRAAERFGQNPYEFMNSMTPEKEQEILSFELLRLRQERAHMAVAVGMSNVLTSIENAAKG